tara:strand:+ start:4745 stop:6868 length:2124 start_codon:yes stop_codon:yes gene_type:complete
MGVAPVLGKIIITFNRDALDGETIYFERYNSISLSPQTPIIESTFVDSTRYANNIIPILTPTSSAGIQSATDFEKYFEIDHNQGKRMSISRVDNVVTIVGENGWEFLNFSSPFASDSRIPYFPPDFTFTGATIEEDDNPCDFVKIQVGCSEIADSYNLGARGVLVYVDTNPFFVSIPRNNRTTITVRKDGISYNVALEEWGINNFYFRKLYISNLQVDITSNPISGATVTINQGYGSQEEQAPFLFTDLEYSLDGSNWFSSNVFSGQIDGEYTAYVRDELGCVIQKDFTVSASGGRDEYFFISDVNSATFSKDEVWNGDKDGLHKQPKNVLALTEQNRTLYEEKRIVKDSDDFDIQFKSNYGEHTIHIEDCRGDDIISFEPNKKSNNLNLFENLDCLGVGVNGKLGLYFLSGNTYNQSDDVTGTYELQGNLPNSAIIGSNIQTYGFQLSSLNSVLVVENILYVEEFSARILITNLNWYGAQPYQGKVKSYYDLIPFEVYEFNLDVDSLFFLSGIRKEFRIRIEAFDNTYETINYYTDYFKVLDSVDYKMCNGINKIVTIDYFNENNRDIFYLYGIRHFMRAEIDTIETLIFDSSENSKGDLKSYIIESKVYKGVKIIFSEVTDRIKVQLALALSSSNLFINGVGYIKEENLEIEKINNTNLYKVTATLSESGANFNTEGEVRTGNVVEYTPTYIPNTISGDTGLIKR